MASGLPKSPTASLLVVYDDAPSRYLLARYLHRGGFRVFEASDGAEALALARRERLDLVVLDVRLPNLSGYEVGRTLRAAPSTASLGIPYVSAYYGPFFAPPATADGGDAFMVQPVDEGELLATMRLVLQARRGSPARASAPANG